MKNIEIYENGMLVKAKAELIKNTLWIHINGETLSLEIESGRVSKRKTKSINADPHRIISPMPGKVTKIFIEVNQSIKEGDSLVVLEAMKMEYTLKASIKGKVKKINCKINDQVPLGELLVELDS